MPIFVIMGEYLLTIIAVAVTALVVWLLTHFISKSRYVSRLADAGADSSKLSSELDSARRMLAHSEEMYEKRIVELKEEQEQALRRERENHELAVRHQKEAGEQALRQQVEALRETMTVESEKALKAREEELGRRAEKTFADISENLGKDLKVMKEAFEANRRTQTETSSELKTKLEDAVRNLEAQTRDIGGKADHLASAMRGQTKFQGCWGETILNNIFLEEGLVDGRDYTQEQTLRDEMGIVLKTDEDRRMRPDFVLHYPDSTDIIVDAKVSLNALSDYIEAGDDSGREDAARRNLEAVREQVRRLSRKDYSSYLQPGRRSLDYVVMFIPNYACLQLAKQLDPNIWRDSFKQNVLITTEETIMPFLRMIRSAWINVEQARNQQQIILSAQRMVDRVYDFAKAHAEMGQKLEDARKCYERCDAKLRDSGQSIIVAARQVQKLGVPANPSKPLPDVLDALPEAPAD